MNEQKHKQTVTILSQPRMGEKKGRHGETNTFLKVVCTKRYWQKVQNIVKKKITFSNLKIPCAQVYTVNNISTKFSNEVHGTGYAHQMFIHHKNTSVHGQNHVNLGIKI